MASSCSSVLNCLKLAMRPCKPSTSRSASAVNCAGPLPAARRPLRGGMRAVSRVLPLPLWLGPR
eukprot:3892922-Alexandrium_andersonii.AAC.1